MFFVFFTKRTLWNYISEHYGTYIFIYITNSRVFTTLFQKHVILITWKKSEQSYKESWEVESIKIKILKPHYNNIVIIVSVYNFVLVSKV